MKTRPMPFLHAVAGLITVVLGAAYLVAQDRPFSREELLQYLRVNLPPTSDYAAYDAASKKAVQLIRQRGVSFHYNIWVFDEELQKAGASSEIKLAMSETYRTAGSASAATRSSAPQEAPGLEPSQPGAGQQAAIPPPASVANTARPASTPGGQTASSPFSRDELLQYLRANLPPTSDYAAYDAASKKTAQLIRDRGVKLPVQHVDIRPRAARGGSQQRDQARDG